MYSVDELQELFFMHPKATSHGVPALRWDGQSWPTTLEQCYQRPSGAKRAAYKRWREFYADFGVDARKWAITGHSCNFFTIEFEFRHPVTGEWWHARATGRSSQAWRIV